MAIDTPETRSESEDEPLLTPDGINEWVRYLDQWEREVYTPLFKARGISRDAALTCWFVNRLRNALPDDDAGSEPWQ